MDAEGRALSLGLRWVYPLVGVCAEVAIGASLISLDVQSPLVLAGALILSSTAVCALLGAVASRRIVRLAECAARDELTRLWNRAEGQRALEATLSDASRHGWPLAVFLVDLDLLKQINDSRGHSAGDESLCLLAESLRTSLRRADVAARFGGDEFLMVTQCEPQDALMLADRVRAQLMRLAIERHVAHIPTVSIGVAAVDGAQVGHTRSAELLAEADLALYEAKRAGRNRASLHHLGASADGALAAPLPWSGGAARVSRS